MFFWKKKKPSYERAMDWFKANMVPGQGIIFHTKQPVPYPEVTAISSPRSIIGTKRSSLAPVTATASWSRNLTSAA